MCSRGKEREGNERQGKCAGPALLSLPRALPRLPAALAASTARSCLHYRVLTLCPAPTDPVGQSWPRGTGSVGDSVGEGAAYVNAGACRGESRAYSNGAYSLPLPCLPICRLFAGAKETHELACGTRRWQAQVARASARARHALTPCASHSAQPTRHTHAHTRTTGGTGRGRPPLDNLEAFDDARMDATVEDVLHVHRRDPVVTLLLHFCDPPFQPPLQLLPHLDQRAQ